MDEAKTIDVEQQSKLAKRIYELCAQHPLPDALEAMEEAFRCVLVNAEPEHPGIVAEFQHSLDEFHQRLGAVPERGPGHLKG